jgi:hypothetical protein
MFTHIYSDRQEKGVLFYFGCSCVGIFLYPFNHFSKDLLLHFFSHFFVFWRSGEINGEKLLYEFSSVDDGYIVLVSQHLVYIKLPNTKQD